MKRIQAFTLFLLPLSLTTGQAQQQEDKEPKVPAKITFEESDRFRLLVKELQVRTAGKIRLGQGLENKRVTVSLKDSGFFQILDALCREHGDATYFNPDRHGPHGEDFMVGPGPWVEYPASYHGHFKVALIHLRRTRARSVGGEGAWVEAGLVLFAPPWIDVGFMAGSEVIWTFKEARSPDGKDLLPKANEPSMQELIRIGNDMDTSGGLRNHLVRLRDFEIGGGLKILEGILTIKSSESKIERLAAEAGKSMEVAGGTLTVESVIEYEKEDDGSRWRIGLTFKPKEGAPPGSDGVDRLFERRVRYDGSHGEWRYQSWSMRVGSFEVETNAIPRAPAWIEFRVRGAERRVEVPFRIQDAAFKKEPK